MEYTVSKDILDVKTLLNETDESLATSFGISRMTLSRIVKNNSVPNKNTLEGIYSFIYKKGIRLNLLNEELYKTNEDNNTRILFHGSKDGIEGEIKVSHGGEKKDFGSGFYLGESVKQGISFVSNYPNSSLYMFSLNLKKLDVIEFDVDVNWMILVAYFRGRIEEYKDSKKVKELLEIIKDKDVIIAPIADNSMYSIINEFIEGSITGKQCINSLSANRLGKQYVLKTEKAIKSLTELKKCYICSLEKEDYESQRETEKNVGKTKVILAKREFAGKGLYIEQLLK